MRRIARSPIQLACFHIRVGRWIWTNLWFELNHVAPMRPYVQQEYYHIPLMDIYPHSASKYIHTSIYVYVIYGGYHIFDNINRKALYDNILIYYIYYTSSFVLQSYSNANISTIQLLVLNKQ